MMKLGLIGKSLRHSASRAIHMMFFQLCGLEGSYDLFEIPDEAGIPHHLALFENASFAGINVTIPYKQAVMPYLDHISTEAESIGAVNTIHFLNGKRYGHNTDYHGFIQTLEREKMETAGKTWLVLGYGGSARSVLAALRDLGAETVCASTRTSGKGFISYSDICGLEHVTGVVNTTPVGMFPDVEHCVIPRDFLRSFQYAVDLIYNPRETLFLQYARSCGLRTANGLYMLVAQAMKAQKIWNRAHFGEDITETIFQRLVVQP